MASSHLPQRRSSESAHTWHVHIAVDALSPGREGRRCACVYAREGRRCACVYARSGLCMLERFAKTPYRLGERSVRHSYAVGKPQRLTYAKSARSAWYSTPPHNLMVVRSVDHDYLRQRVCSVCVYDKHLTRTRSVLINTSSIRLLEWRWLYCLLLDRATRQARALNKQTSVPNGSPPP